MSERETQQTHTRRVLDTAENNVWERIAHEAEAESYGADSITLLDRKKEEEFRRKQAHKKARQAKKKPQRKANARPAAKDMSPEGMRQRHQKAQKARRRFAARVHACIALAAAGIIITALLLTTPLFDIKSISVSGNNLVSAEEVSELIGDVKGTNLFRASENDIIKKLKTVKYINSVAVKKNLIPRSIDIVVTEHRPAGYIQAGSQLLVLDKDAYIIDTASQEEVASLPCMIGVKIKKSDVQDYLVTENPDVCAAIKDFLDIFEQCGETANIKSVDFSNMSNISFNYQNRITGLCGTHLSLDKKLRLFCVTVNNEEIDESARGTIDLSKTGTAIYDP